MIGRTRKQRIEFCECGGVFWRIPESSRVRSIFPALRVWNVFCKRCGATHKTSHNRVNRKVTWIDRQRKY